MKPDAGRAQFVWMQNAEPISPVLQRRRPMAVAAGLRAGHRGRCMPYEINGTAASRRWRRRVSQRRPDGVDMQAAGA